MKEDFLDNKFESGRYSFDFDNEVFIVSGKPRKLERSEIRLLRILTDNAGITIDNRILISRMWEGVDLINDDILKERAGELARKISAKRYIKSDGSGYKWKL